MSMKGKAAIVTGSTSGIGKAIAETLAANNIVLNGFGDAAEIERQRAALANAHRVEVVFDGADLSQPKTIDALMDKALAKSGAVDILVNNAGIQYVASIDELPIDKWNAILAINLSSSFHAIRRAVPVMKARKWGRIIKVATAHALVASPFKCVYVAAKHANAGLIKTVALEVAEHDVTVNAICPGYVWTPLVEKRIPQTARACGISEEQVITDVLLHAQPTKAFVTVKEVARLTAYLASDAAASITGVVILTDGGWTAQ
jgi:3-hydroxybutyrate dehydrogenase